MSWVTSVNQMKSGLVMGFSDKAFAEKVQSKYDVLMTVIGSADPQLQWHDGDTYLIEGIEFDSNLTYMITGAIVEKDNDTEPYCVICNIISGKPFLTVIRNDDLAIEQYTAKYLIRP